ncbi:MFS transporter [Salidesulfovibrio onnuriiensis]|uniref:MFS transporter n=1 Tax=Salidesulfovibrio onnuriiensis TaxID=2583823 RepID=UPI0011CCD347|nr:MFS transporter [Salidesulfovibrio onnuriiensis]
MARPETDSRPLARTLPAVLLVVFLFFLNFLTRITLGPLMPVVEAELGFSHAHAGGVFLALGMGNGIGLFLSGFLSREIGHRRTVGWSAVIVGCMALVASHAWSHQSLQWIFLALGVCVGLYLPSGIAVVTSLVRKEDWGKTLSLHELAPNTAFIAAPLLAELVLLWWGWRSSLALLGGCQLLLGAYFLRFGTGGDFPGVTPFSSEAGVVLRSVRFWLLVVCCAWAVGMALGPYSMMPLFLIEEHGYTREAANQLLAVSRVAAVFVSLLGGWLTDKWGAKPVMTVYCFCCGLATILLGSAQGGLLVVAVLLQPVCTVIFFPAGLTLLSKMFDPGKRTAAISFMGPINAILGVGVIPWGLGILGERGDFSLGFIFLGACCLLLLLILPLLPREE